MCDIDVPGKPFRAIATSDGKWVLVSLVGPPAHGIGVLRRTTDGAELSHVVPLEHVPLGIAISPSGDLLAVAHFSLSGVGFVDVKRAINKTGGSYLGYVQTGESMGSILVAFSPDGTSVFVSEERQASVSVISVTATARIGYSEQAVVGQIPVDFLPVGMAISPDGQALYVTSEATEPVAMTGPDIYTPKIVTRSLSRKGTLTVIDVSVAQQDPANSVNARVPAGENPVRLALSHAGSRAWITSRANNRLLVLDTAAARRESDSEIAAVDVGIAPVGVVVTAEDRIAVVANSNRFSETGESSLSVIDVEAVLAGEQAAAGVINVGKFARELSIAPGGRTLFLTNFESRTVTLLDVPKLEQVALGR